MSNYKPGFQVTGDPKFYTNSLVFASKEEALASADELMTRWTAVEDTSAIETQDPVTHKFEGGIHVSI